MPTCCLTFEEIFRPSYVPGHLVFPFFVVYLCMMVDQIYCLHLKHHHYSDSCFLVEVMSLSHWESYWPVVCLDRVWWDFFSIRSLPSSGLLSAIYWSSSYCLSLLIYEIIITWGKPILWKYDMSCWGVYEIFVRVLHSAPSSRSDLFSFEGHHSSLQILLDVVLVCETFLLFFLYMYKKMHWTLLRDIAANSKIWDSY